MRSLNARTWTILDWWGAISGVLAAVFLAVNAALKEYPTLAAYAPGLHDSAFMAFSPLVLIGVFAVAVVVRTRAPVESEVRFSPDQLEEIRYAGRPVFRLEPQHFTVELVAQLPYVEVRFFVINFLPHHIVLT